MLDFRLLPLLSCTFSLIANSHARPNPQANEDSTAVANAYSINGTTPANETDNALGGGADGANYPTFSITNNTATTGSGTGAFDLADFTFNPLQMPTEPGLNATEPTKILQPLQKSSASPNGPASSDSTLSSRDITNKIFLTATTDSMVTADSLTVYTVAADPTTLAPFFQEVEAYGINTFIAGPLQGNESNHDLIGEISVSSPDSWAT